MAVYTTTVRSICETYAGKTESVGRLHTAEVIELARPKIFDFLYPIFDESYRTVLETKILRHYYYKEIGFETVGLWQDRLETKLGEIMPYYNELYKSIVHDFNPNYDCDWYRVGHKTDDSTERNTGTVSDQGTNTGTVTDNGTNTGTVTDHSTTAGTVENEGTNTGTVSDQGSSFTKRHPELNTRVFENDTPQGALAANLDSNTYLSKYDRTEQTGKEETDLTTGNTRTDNLSNTNTQTSDINTDNTRTDNLANSNTRTNNLANSNTRTDDLTRKFDNTNEYTEHVYGIQNGTNYISMIKDFRDQIINIDMLIIESLNDLFMNLW